MIHVLQTLSTAEAILKEEGLAMPTGVPEPAHGWKGTGDDG